MIGGLGGGGGEMPGLDLHELPIVGGLLFDDPTQKAQEAQLQKQAEVYAGMREPSRQAQENIMRQSSIAFQPMQDLMAEMYGPGAQIETRTGMFNNPLPSELTEQELFARNQAGGPLDQMMGMIPGGEMMGGMMPGGMGGGMPGGMPGGGGMPAMGGGMPGGMGGAPPGMRRAPQGPAGMAAMGMGAPPEAAAMLEDAAGNPTLQDLTRR